MGVCHVFVRCSSMCATQSNVYRPGTAHTHTHTHVSVGFSHILAITVENTVYSWGEGGSGQLGHEDTISRSKATVIESLKARTITR